jgi:hypothetical protein
MNREAQFEQLLRRQPPREIPAAWREEILAAAAIHGRALPAREPDFAARWRLRLRELLWPCPQVWASLATVWVAILAINFATAEATPQAEIRRVESPAPERWQMFRQQQQMLAELGGPTERVERDSTKPAIPQPRSQRREEFGLA